MSHLQQFLRVVNFAGNFIKDLAKYKKDFRVLLKANERFVWKEIHTQRIPRIIRWQTECQYYVFNINVIKSHENVLGDFLTIDEFDTITTSVRHLQENIMELQKNYDQLTLNVKVGGNIQ
ncbi:hypothetical protein ACS0TY_024450 [Phlomoides rotata]